MAARGGLRVAALSDVHYSRHTKGLYGDLFAQAASQADVLAICGDLTDYGLPEEAQLLVSDLRAHVRIPVLAVLGNHDFESGRADEVVAVMEEAGVTMLDGACVEVGGVGFAGVCGFGGGFGDRMLNAWGERLIKEFVQAAVDEELKLEHALSRLDTPARVAILHYAPIRETVEGEPPEIFPFLGSSRLEEPLNRFEVRAAFHGHAHHGVAEGKTAAGCPVYNVSIPVLKELFPDKPPFRVVTVARENSKGPSS
ncbi:MAG TPA: metallophosphoesterase [Rhodothermales bacterium]